MKKKLMILSDKQMTKNRDSTQIFNNFDYDTDFTKKANMT